MKFLYSLTLLALSFNVFSQRSKDGAVTISGANTIVNAYTPVTADANAGSTTINVGSSAGFNVGDLILIIQMQGARVNAQWDTIWADPNNSMSLPNSNNIDFGAIKDYHNTGTNEFAEISSIPDGTSIVLDCGLKSSYTYSYTNYQGCFPNGSGIGHTMYGHIQVIKVPRYSTLTISGAGSITCPQWNGTIGGVAVVEIENNATLSSTPSFNVSGKGFRGGIKDNAISVFGGNKWGALNQNQGGYKGESIFGDTTITKDYAALICRGAIANGGGGGDAHNAGGGGGANGGAVASYNGYGNPTAGYNAIWNLEGGTFSANTSSGGGRGGYTFSDQNRTVTTAPGAISTNSNTWGGDMRRNAGGLGGRPLDYSTGRIYLGGGGGAGDGNDNQAGAGGNGGGLVYVVCYGNLSGAGTIVADGSNGSNSTAGCITNDGGGGGGGGGTILLKVNGTIALTAATPLSAIGGNGGNVNFNCAINNDTGYGPGGSGGGGYIATTGALPANSVVAGTNGIQSGNSSNISTNFPPNGATKGGSGSTGSLTSYTLNASANQALCVNQSFTVTATSTAPSTSINWYNNSVGGSAIATGTVYVPPTYTATGTYTIYAGSCPGVYRLPIIITVNAGATITVNSPTICPNETVTITAGGATTYTWSTGPANTNPVSVSPATTTVYTVNATSGLCINTKTTQVTVSSIPTISVTSATICAGNSATLTATGTTTNYAWSPGGQTTSSIVVTPSINTTYSVSGSDGVCTNSTTATVTIIAKPTVSVPNATICTGTSTVLTASGTSTSFTWMPGSITTSTISANSNTTYSITGSNGTCTNSTTATVTVASLPTVSVPNATICTGTSTVLTASGTATSFTWMPGNITTSTISANSNTNYTITGSNGICTNSTTATVTVVALPTVSVPNATICAGTSTVLTASGTSTSFTWMPGSVTTSTISANSNTTYSITGSNGTCTNSTTATVTVVALPTVTVPNATICTGTSTVLTASGTATSFTWMPGNITTSTISANSNTNYTITGSNGICTNSTTATVTVASLPTVSVPSATICASTSTVLTASGTATSFTWMPGSITTSTISANSNTNYTITGSNGTCTNSTTATVTVVSLPTISVPNATICSGTSTVLTVSGTATSYTWQAGGQTTNTLSVNPNTTTTYTVIGSDGACTNSTTSTVSVTPTPTITGVSNTTICANQTATFTADGATSFTWQPANFVGATYIIAPSSNSVISVIGANGTCTSSATASITIGTDISISVNNPTICAGQTASLTASGATSYTWNTGPNTNTLNVSPALTTTYTVLGNVGACSGSNTAVVTIVSAPSISVTTASICSGSSATLTASGASNYTWMPGGQTTFSIVDNPNITTTYTITGGNSVCTNTTTASVSVTATPTLIANSTTVCSGQTATLSVSGAGTFTWNPGNVTGATYTLNPGSSTTVSVIGANGTCTSQATPSITAGSGISITVNSETICDGQTATLSATGITTYSWNTGSNSNPITVSPTSTTVYTVAGNNGSCSGTQTATVTVNAVPVLTVTSNDICSGQTATLNVSGADTYTWNPGNLSASTQTVSPTSTTIYTVLGTDANGCVNSSASYTTVNVTATPTITVNPSTICVGQTATLTATGATSFTWSTIEITSTINPTPALTTTYSVLGSDLGCLSSPFTATVSVDNTTLTTYSLAVATCPSETVTLVGAGTNSATTTYSWSNGINTYSQTVAPINTTTYVVNGTSLSGCPALSGTVIVNVNSISANFSGLNSEIMTVGETLNLTDISTGAASILWDYCNGVSASNQITIPLPDAGICCIKLIVTNASCKDSITKCVTIVNEAVVIIPNVFTPNGDGKNDLFKITSTGLKSLSCIIFDRWGLKMYEWDGINGFWDGHTKAGSATAGTYFYIINYTDEKDKSTTEKGFLTLFKD